MSSTSISNNIGFHLMIVYEEIYIPHIYIYDICISPYLDVNISDDLFGIYSQAHRAHIWLFRTLVF